MKSIISEWLPMTKRNRVALGFAALALVIFLIWNFLPYDSGGENWISQTAAMHIWPEVFSPGSYIMIMAWLGYFEGGQMIVMMISMIHSGMLVLAILPFWRMLHASTCLRLCLAVMNLAGSYVTFYFTIWGFEHGGYVQKTVFFLIASSMLALSLALFIFKNELQLRHERDAEETLNSKL